MTPLALDIVIALIIVASTVAAYLRGLIKESFTLAGLILAVLFAYKFGHLLVPEFNDFLGVTEDDPVTPEGEKPRLIWGVMSPPLAAKVFSYGGIFIFSLFLMMLVGYFVSRWVNEAGLGVLDRVLGGVFGFLRGFLLVLLVYLPCTYLLDYKKFPDWARFSYSVPVLQGTTDWINANYKLDEKVQSSAGGVMIKFKGEGDKKDANNRAEAELKEAIAREEKAEDNPVTPVVPDRYWRDLP